MSRKIDPNKPLSKADKEYLMLWSREGDIYQHELNLAARQAEPDVEDDDDASSFDDDLIDSVEAMSVEDIKAELKQFGLKYGGDDKVELAERLLNRLQDDREAAKS